jgi:hypothetical protein
MPTVYLILPDQIQNPHITEWMAELTLPPEGPDWTDWKVKFLFCDKQAQIEINPLRARIQLLPGPIATIEPISNKTWTAITRAMPAVIAISQKVTCADDILVLLNAARLRHIDGEPMFPRRRVAAVRIVRDLSEHNAWGGISKSYRWWFHTRNDIGPQFTPVADDVIIMLKQHGLVESKKSQGKPKYCLVKERAREINAIVMEANFWNTDLQASLDRDRTSYVSAAFLLEPKQATQWKVGQKGQPLAAFDSAQKGIVGVRELPDHDVYLWEIHYGGQNRSLREEDKDKDVIIRTFEVYLR